MHCSAFCIGRAQPLQLSRSTPLPVLTVAHAGSDSQAVKIGV